MKLTRRDAVAALAALGTAGAAAGYGKTRQDAKTTAESAVLDTYVATAAVVYPAELAGVEEFVRSFLPARLERKPQGTAMRETVTELNEVGKQWYDGPVTALSPDERDQLLREVGADTADEDPAGTFAERVRYHVVNELLLALYASPTGGELVGIENPQGHPGGTDTYQRGPL